jgi:branched-chain amino acid transport system permease protein
VSSVVQNAIDAVSQGSLYALFALGVALIFGIMRLVNFAHGELITGGAYALVLVSGPPLLVRVGATVVAVVVLAILMERVAFRPVRGADPSTLLVTSFAVSYVLQNLAILVFGSVPRSTNLSTALSHSVTIGSIDVAKLEIVTIAVTLVLLGCLAAFLNRTTFGVQMRAAAEDFDMARLLGVRADLVIAAAFAIAGLLAAVAAALLVAQTGTVTATMGITPVIFGFIATILGGMGSLSGAVLGGFVVGALGVVLQAALPLDVRPYRDAFLFLAVIAMLVARPSGLVVARSTETRV